MPNDGTTEELVTRYHVYTGMRGYMPDGDDGIGAPMDLAAALDACAWEINGACEYIREYAEWSMTTIARRSAETEDERDGIPIPWEGLARDAIRAWREHERGESLDNLSTDLTSVVEMLTGRREMAPLYRDADGLEMLKARGCKLLEVCDGIQLGYASHLWIEKCDHAAGECDDADDPTAMNEDD